MMAEKYAREQKGYEWDIIAGVSVGALNGMMLAMEKYARLEEMWWHITRDQVMTGRLNFWTAFKIALGAKSIYSNDPLRELIQREYEPDRIRTDFRIGTVSLRMGKYVRFTPSDPGFDRAVLASTAIPLVWDPVDVSPNYPDMVDGGVRTISPLGDVISDDPDEIVIINCDNAEPPVHLELFQNALDIGVHVLDIMLTEIMQNDIREFIRINKNVDQAAAKGGQLYSPKGKLYRSFKYKLIEPEEPLGDTLDFSPEVIRMRMDAGWETARKVLG